MARQVQLRTYSEEEVSKNIRKNIETLKRDLDIQEKVLQVLSDFENKSITKRMATAFTNRVTNVSATVEHNYGLWHFNVYTKNPENPCMRDRRQFFLGHYNDVKYLTTERLQSLRNAFVRDKGRLAHYEAAVAKVPEWVAKYNEAVLHMQAVYDSMREAETEYSLPIGYLFD